MKKSNSKSFQDTLTLAATLAALGASLGVPSSALSQQLSAQSQQFGDGSATGAQASAPSSGGDKQNLKKIVDVGATQQKNRNINQQKLDNGIGANQIKYESKGQASGFGANQLKVTKGTKQGNGVASPAPTQNNQLPAVQ